MITIEEMKNLFIYNKPFFTPLKEKDNKHGSLCYLLSPTIESSLKIINHKLMINRKYFESYYIEKDITYFITKEGFLIDSDDIPYNVISESVKEEYFSNPERYVQALDLRMENTEFKAVDKEPINEFDILEDLEKNVYTTSIPKYETSFPPKMSKVDIDKIKEVVQYRSELYFKVVSRSWSDKKKHDKYPFKTKSALSYNLMKKYFNTDSKDCIIPRDKVNRNYKIYFINIEKDNKFYPVIFTYNNDIDHIWILFNDELISIDQFVPELIREETIEEDVKEIKKIDTRDCLRLSPIYGGYKIENYYIRDNNSVIIFNNSTQDILNEATKKDSIMHKLLYRERFKNNKEVFDIYDQIKKDSNLRYAFIDLDRYKNMNLFYDMHMYINSFFKNNYLNYSKSIEVWTDFLDKFFNDSRFNLYSRKTVFINVFDWIDKDKFTLEDNLDYKKNFNPLSAFVKLFKTDLKLLQDKWSNLDFVFLTDTTYFKVNFRNVEDKDYIKFLSTLKKLISKEPVPEDKTEKPESTKSIVQNIIYRLEDRKGIKVYNLTGKDSDISKKELEEKIEKAANISADTDDAINKIDDDQRFIELLQQIQIDDNELNINASRAARINKLQDEFLKKNVNGKSVKELLEKDDSLKELPVTKLELDTVNKDWEHLQYINFNKEYDINEDIVAILNSFSKMSVPVAVRDINIEDTKTSEDYIQTWKIDFEDANGNRFSIRLDIPLLIDNSFMMLRGNKKTINNQAVLLPISKTDDDTVQIVSNYNKIFIRRYGSSVPGKMYVGSDLSIKVIDKYFSSSNKDSSFKVSTGDNLKVSSKYELPIDYIDLSALYSKIETKKTIYYFNQDQIREEYNISTSAGIPIGVDKSSQKVIYFEGDGTFSSRLLIELIGEYPDMMEILNSLKPSNKYTYSKASILNTEIPLIVMMAYSEGLTKALDKAKIKYDFQEKRPSIKSLDGLNKGFIKFRDAYLVYDLNISSSLLMNGLKECNTEDYSVTEINTKAMYLDFLSLFGTRLLSDGLDNFYDLMLDPITLEVLEDLKLPTDYIELCAYANVLLADNKYIEHTNLESNRFRSNEIISGYVYKALSESYGTYRNDLKRSSKASMTIKQSKVLDLILLDPTASDASILNPLLEAETLNAVSFKGLSGMNSDRSYGLDKRTYSDSMINVLAMSTGFAGNVGITRQTTIDMGVKGKRGYIKQSNNPTDEMSITKTFGITEALIPYASTHDDPFRLAMGYIQNSKHAMRTEYGAPQFITNGADQALPYLITNTFAFKAKEPGKVIEIVPDKYMILEYRSGKRDFVDLRDNVKKNSNAGFFTSVKLDTNLKVGNTFKEGEILAYDKSSFSPAVGYSGNISYKAGIPCMVALLNTDEGFEDSGIVSSWLSKAAASPVIIEKDIYLPKNTNIISMCKKGDSIEEGDQLLVFQNAYDEEDVAILMKTLAEDEDEVTDLGKIILKSKYTGIVKDIKVYRTVEKNELSDSLKKLVNSVEKESDQLNAVSKKNNIEYIEGLNANYKLEQSGKLKKVQDGILIEIYIEYHDMLSVGDKMILLTANKMVMKDIWEPGQEPTRDFDKLNTIDAFGSIGGTSARMVTSIENTMALNKVIYYMGDISKEMLGIKVNSLHDKVEKINI